MIFLAARLAAKEDTRYRLVTLANQHFFTLAHMLNVWAQTSLQFGNVYGAHGPT